MSLRKKPQIRWGSNLKTYMYGTEITYQEDGAVTYYNPLVPSGTEIQSWLAIQNYQASRSQPALPLLKKGHSYQITAQLQAVPDNAVYLKLVFLDRYDQEISQIIEKSQTLTFTYPPEAYTYRLALLSAGLVQMTFTGIDIDPVGGDHV